ncbi:hypothetical protein BS50DRAFT_666856 [Corynespora cassiicola Philippines]|uniref:BTB domain-containing protein n=1 Tax=Corynespora cassiicola Philippines TaxID=1448308 RepID=A0A2T2NN24_CORCC|nr:hypothetical protein BS50DRAFT_666856 [Corynespora cassiicola Philippines]
MSNINGLPNLAPKHKSSASGTQCIQDKHKMPDKNAEMQEKQREVDRRRRDQLIEEVRIQEDFSKLLQGACVKVTFSASTADDKPPVFHLPITLISAQSTFFNTTCSNPASDPLPITLPPTITPPTFALFLRFLYQGSYPLSTDIISARCGNPIPPSAAAWLAGHVLGSPAFMNHAIYQLFSGIGHYYPIGPEFVDWVCAHTPTPSPLRALVLDLLSTHWSLTTPVITKSPDLVEKWHAVLEKHPEFRKEFLFGLQGGKKIAPMHMYFMGTKGSWGGEKRDAQKEGTEKEEGEGEAKKPRIEVVE